MRLWIALAGCVLLAGCATDSVDREAPAPAKGRVTLEQEGSTLGLTVRTIGERFGGGLVLMKGIENRPTPPLTFKKAKFEAVARQLAADAHCMLQIRPSYYFICPPGYEALFNLDVLGQLPPALAEKNVDSLAFGAGTRLMSAFMLLGQTLETTIVADNIVAEAECGEMALRNVSLEETLSAIIKSARLVGFRVESTPEYVLFLSPGNATPRSTLLNEAALTPEQREMLERRVSLVLPAPPAEPGELPAHMERLAGCLPAISEQLGMPVVAEESLEDFPVNPASFNNVAVGTALDLLIRQWPVAEFGYHVTHDRIVIRRRQPAEMR